MYSRERQATSVAGVLSLLLLVVPWICVPIASTLGFYIAAAAGALVASRLRHQVPPQRRDYYREREPAQAFLPIDPPKAERPKRRR